MRYTTAILLAMGATVVHAAGAVAKEQEATHLMTVQLPFGGVETIQYKGDTAPTVTTWSGFVPGNSLAAFWIPSWGFPDAPSLLQTLNRQMAAFDRAFEPLQRGGARAGDRSVGEIASYCAETVELSQVGNQTPRVTRHTYGACGAAQQPRSTTASAPTAGSANHT